MEKQSRTVRLQAKITPDLSHRLDTLADRMGITRSELVYRVIAGGLEDLESAASIAESRLGGALLRVACSLLPDPQDREDVLGQLDRLRHSRRSRDAPQLPYAAE